MLFLLCRLSLAILLTGDCRAFICVSEQTVHPASSVWMDAIPAGSFFSGERWGEAFTGHGWRMAQLLAAGLTLGSGALTDAAVPAASSSLSAAQVIYGGAKTVGIEAGMNLTRYAERFDTSIDTLLHINTNLQDPNLIIQGRDLMVPVKQVFDLPGLPALPPLPEVGGLGEMLSALSAELWPVALVSILGVASVMLLLQAYRSRQASRLSWATAVLLLGSMGIPSSVDFFQRWTPVVSVVNAAAARVIPNVKGVVKAIAPDKKRIVVTHENIPDVMPPMTMPFDVRDPKILDGLQPGQSIVFELEVSEDFHYTITKIKPQTVSSPPKRAQRPEIETPAVFQRVQEREHRRANVLVNMARAKSALLRVERRPRVTLGAGIQWETGLLRAGPQVSLAMANPFSRWEKSRLERLNTFRESQALLEAMRVRHTHLWNAAVTQWDYTTALSETGRVPLEEFARMAPPSTDPMEAALQVHGARLHERLAREGAQRSRLRKLVPSAWQAQMSSWPLGFWVLPQWPARERYRADREQQAVDASVEQWQWTRQQAVDQVRSALAIVQNTHDPDADGLSRESLLRRERQRLESLWTLQRWGLHAEANPDSATQQVIDTFAHAAQEALGSAAAVLTRLPLAQSAKPRLAAAEVWREAEPLRTAVLEAEVMPMVAAQSGVPSQQPDAGVIPSAFPTGNLSLRNGIAAWSNRLTLQQFQSAQMAAARAAADQSHNTSLLSLESRHRWITAESDAQPRLPDGFVASAAFHQAFARTQAALAAQTLVNRGVRRWETVTMLSAVPGESAVMTRVHLWQKLFGRSGSRIDRFVAREVVAQSILQAAEDMDRIRRRWITHTELTVHLAEALEGSVPDTERRDLQQRLAQQQWLRAAAEAELAPWVAYLRASDDSQWKDFRQALLTVHEGRWGELPPAVAAADRAVETLKQLEKRTRPGSMGADAFFSRMNSGLSGAFRWSPDDQKDRRFAIHRDFSDHEVEAFEKRQTWIRECAGAGAAAAVWMSVSKVEAVQELSKVGESIETVKPLPLDAPLRWVDAPDFFLVAQWTSALCPCRLNDHQSPRHLGRGRSLDVKGFWGRFRGLGVSGKLWTIWDGGQEKHRKESWKANQKQRDLRSETNQDLMQTRMMELYGQQMAALKRAEDAWAAGNMREFVSARAALAKAAHKLHADVAVLWRLDPKAAQELGVHWETRPLPEKRTSTAPADAPANPVVQSAAGLQPLPRLIGSRRHSTEASRLAIDYIRGYVPHLSPVTVERMLSTAESGSRSPSDIAPAVALALETARVLFLWDVGQSDELKTRFFLEAVRLGSILLDQSTPGTLSKSLENRSVRKVLRRAVGSHHGITAIQELSDEQRLARWREAIIKLLQRSTSSTDRHIRAMV